MAIVNGTEGPDNLTNDTSHETETINGLGGDDVITMHRPYLGRGFGALEANGGDGYDILHFDEFTVSSTVTGSGSGVIFVRANSQVGYNLTYTGMERLEISGSLFGNTPNFVTGDTQDILDLWAEFQNSPTVSTGDGNDVIRWTYRLNTWGPSSITIYGEGGDDVINFGDIALPVSSNGTGYVQNGYGGDGNDHLIGSIYSDSLYGGDGDDYLDGGSQKRAPGDTMVGGPGNDTYYQDTLADTVTELPGEGTDEIRTNLVAYTLFDNFENLTGVVDTGQALTGNAVANRITGAGGNDTLDGMDGDDVLAGNAGADTYTGGTGTDAADFSGETGGNPVIVNLGSLFIFPAGNAGATRSLNPNEAIDSYGNYETLSGIENIRTGPGNDRVTGNAGANRIDTGAGNDFLDGGAGDDVLLGGTGDDTYLVDSTGDSVTELAGEGTDAVWTALGTLASIFVLPSNVENFSALSNAGQAVAGNMLDNAFTMGGGNDVVDLSSGGNDFVAANGGNDFVYFGAALTAADSVDGGSGTDTVALLGIYNLTLGAGTLNGIETLNLLSGSTLGGSDRFGYSIVTNDANVPAGGQLTVFAGGLLADETLLFNASAETDAVLSVIGGAGNDIFAGGPANDTFVGGGGNDLLVGLNGNDWLEGDAGADTLRGGFGSDLFVYKSASDSPTGGMDHILDFEDTTDLISLQGIDANVNAGGDQAFTFIGADAFHGTAGELRVYQSGADFIVEGDTNGDGAADFAIQVTTVTGYGLDAPDFML